MDVLEPEDHREFVEHQRGSDPDEQRCDIGPDRATAGADREERAGHEQDQTRGRVVQVGAAVAEVVERPAAGPDGSGDGARGDEGEHERDETQQQRPLVTGDDLVGPPALSKRVTNPCAKITAKTAYNIAELTAEAVTVVAMGT